MISLGIGWVPVWEVCSQAFTGLHFGTSVAATKTGRSVVSTDRAAAHLLPEAVRATLTGFIYRSPDDTPAGEALARWATEIVPAVREAITR
jgi:selenocysteine lyase/cysteine desulfurase